MDASKFFLRGEIDVADADHLVDTLRGAAATQPGPVVVDCMDLTFIDAAGISALVLVHGELACEGRDLCLVHPSPFFERVLGLLNLTSLVSRDAIAASAEQ